MPSTEHKTGAEPRAENLHNPMWKYLEPKVQYDSRFPWDRGWKIPMIPWRKTPSTEEGLLGIQELMREKFSDEEYLQVAREHGRRQELVRAFAWTITDPRTITFISRHAGPRIHDPLAGTGYWAYLLSQMGHSVTAGDRSPGNNSQAQGSYFPMAQVDARTSTYQAGARATLLLSWPPYQCHIGHRVIRAYRGDRIIYIGEGQGGCCGTDGMFHELDRAWREVDWHRPAQWEGLHDYVTVYRRVKRFGQ